MIETQVGFGRWPRGRAGVPWDTTASDTGSRAAVAAGPWMRMRGTRRCPCRRAVGRRRKDPPRPGRHPELPVHPRRVVARPRRRLRGPGYVGCCRRCRRSRGQWPPLPARAGGALRRRSGQRPPTLCVLLRDVIRRTRRRQCCRRQRDWFHCVRVGWSWCQRC